MPTKGTDNKGKKTSAKQTDSKSAKPAEKKSAAKSEKNQPKKAAPANEVQNEPSLAGEIFRSIVPYLLCCLGLFIAVCYIFTDATGILGSAIRTLSYGLFSGGAVTIPILIFVMAVFWRRDSEAGLCGWKAFFSFIFLLFISVTVHAFTKGTGSGEIDIKHLWQKGLEWYGGGAFGGIIGGLLLRGIGKAGTLIVSFTFLTVFGLFLVGLTPKSAAVWIAYQIHEYREKTRIRRELDAAMPTPNNVRRGSFAEAQNEGLYRGQMPSNNQPIIPVQQRDRSQYPISSEPDEAAEKPRKIKGKRELVSDVDNEVRETTFDAGNVAETEDTVPISGMMQYDDPIEAERADTRARIAKRRETAAASVKSKKVMTSVPEAMANDEPAIDEAVFDEVLRRTESGAYLCETENELEKAAEFAESETPAEDTPLENAPGEIPTPDAYDPDNITDNIPDEIPEAVQTETLEPINTAEVEVPSDIPRRADGSIALEELFAPSDIADDNTADKPANTDDIPFEIDESDFEDMNTAQKIEKALDRSHLDTDNRLDTDAGLEIERRSAVPGNPEIPEDTTPKPPDKKPKKPYELPPLTLLKLEPAPDNTDVRDELQTTAKKLVDTLTSFKVRTRIINISRGPTITRYELAPEEGVRVRSIANLVDDIALNLATTGVRIEAPIPGKSAVGIEVPNRVVATVHLRELLQHDKFKNAKSIITAGLGMDVAGEPIFCDISKMPHLLIAGTTGSGKSVCINSMIISLLYKASPDDVRLILVDPKKVELNVYNGLPHLLVPVVSDPKKAAGALHWAVTEMERRYELIEAAGVRNLEGYNEYIKDVPPDENGNKPEKLSRIVIVIDELADLMMTAPDEIEESICRIAQKARAAGMHLIIGTQRPSVDVITGLIKANVPSRIAFTVSNQMDSRIIIDTAGAEKLIGRGDMLYSPIGSTKPVRVQGTFVSDDEVADICDFIKRQDYVAVYDDSVINSIEEAAAMCGAGKKGSKVQAISDPGEGEDGSDPMLKPAIELAVESGKISTSLIQRRLSLGYGRAAKLIDRMQEMGIVSAPEGQKPRNVLISKQQYMEMVLNRDIE